MFIFYFVSCMQAISTRLLFCSSPTPLPFPRITLVQQVHLRFRHDVQAWSHCLVFVRHRLLSPIGLFTNQPLKHTFLTYHSYPGFTTLACYQVSLVPSIFFTLLFYYCTSINRSFHTKPHAVYVPSSTLQKMQIAMHFYYSYDKLLYIKCVLMKRFCRI